MEQQVISQMSKYVTLQDKSTEKQRELHEQLQDKLNQIKKQEECHIIELLAVKREVKLEGVLQSLARYSTYLITCASINTLDTMLFVLTERYIYKNMSF